jgi:hypothetical protein
MVAKGSAKPAKPVKSSQESGRYLYAVIETTKEVDLGPVGIDGRVVYAINDGRVAAVVSDLPNEKLRPERRRLAAHHDVLKRLMATETVLPMAFGIVADGPEAIRRILAQNQEAFVGQLERFAGKVEMGLRVCWDVPNIFEFFVNTHIDLRQFRDRIFRAGREPSQEEKIELGRTFDHALMGDRESHTERVMSVLDPLCAEIKENKPRNEREVMNLACLIDRGRQKEFEQGVFAAAKFFDHHYAFDFNGPWPPHNFVDIALDT